MRTNEYKLIGIALNSSLTVTQARFLFASLLLSAELWQAVRAHVYSLSTCLDQVTAAACTHIAFFSSVMTGRRLRLNGTEGRIYMCDIGNTLPGGTRVNRFCLQPVRQLENTQWSSLLSQCAHTSRSDIWPFQFSVVKIIYLQILHSFLR